MLPISLEGDIQHTIPHGKHSTLQHRGRARLGIICSQATSERRIYSRWVKQTMKSNGECLAISVQVKLGFTDVEWMTPMQSADGGMTVLMTWQDAWVIFKLQVWHNSLPIPALPRSSTLTRLNNLQFGQLLEGRRISFWDCARAMAGTGVMSWEEDESPCSEAMVRDWSGSRNSTGGQRRHTLHLPVPTVCWPVGKQNKVNGKQSHNTTRSLNNWQRRLWKIYIPIQQKISAGN